MSCNCFANVCGLCVPACYIFWFLLPMLDMSMNLFCFDHVPSDFGFSFLCLVTLLFKLPLALQFVCFYLLFGCLELLAFLLFYFLVVGVTLLWF